MDFMRFGMEGSFSKFMDPVKDYPNPGFIRRVVDLRGGRGSGTPAGVRFLFLPDLQGRRHFVACPWLSSAAPSGVALEFVGPSTRRQDARGAGTDQGLCGTGPSGPGQLPKWFICTWPPMSMPFTGDFRSGLAGRRTAPGTVTRRHKPIEKARNRS